MESNRSKIPLNRTQTRLNSKHEAGQKKNPAGRITNPVRQVRKSGENFSYASTVNFRQSPGA